jgi:tetratricopeptide (TPR) repeat protein
VGQAAVNRLLQEAVEHYDFGRSSEAEARCGDILIAYPDHIPALHLSAVIAFVTDRAAQGAVLLSRVFNLDPDHAPAFATLGDALAMTGEREGAVAAFERAVMLRPQDAGLCAKLGTALFELSRFDDAEVAYRRAIELDPNFVRARFNLAVTLATRGRLAEAEEAYRAVIARDPDYRGVWLNLAGVLTNQKKLDDAVAAYRHALTVDPDDPGNIAPLRLLGFALYEAGRLDEAVWAYRQASARDPGNPVFLNDLGGCLCALGQLDEAIEACARAVAADPAYAQGYANLAVALRSAGQIDEALAASHRAVTRDPDQPQTLYNHAHLLLMSGDLKAGFDEFHWGRKCKTSSHTYPVYSEPEWQGEALAGRTLLLFAEAGLGDALHFVRYLPMVAAMGGPIVLRVQPALVPLLRTMAGVTVVPRGEALPPFDLQLPLMDLARVFGTTLDTIPAAVPYLHPDPSKLALWRRRIGDKTFGNKALGNKALGDTGSLKVGVVWAGNPKPDPHRSLSAAAALPRLIMPGVQLYSLQKELRPADIPALAALGADVIDLAPAFGDFADTAAAIGALDLVIAVDTSVAHLAGALGRPIWALLPSAADWRWLRDREDSPWYPTMRLFRQHKPRAWESVLARVSSELARVAAGERALIWPPSRGD